MSGRLLHRSDRLIGRRSDRLSNSTTSGAGSRLNRGGDNAGGSWGRLHNGGGDCSYGLRGLGRSGARLNHRGGNRSSYNRSLRGGGDGNSGSDLGSRRRNGYGNRGGHGGGHARIGLSRSLGYRRGSRRVLLRELGDGLHVTGSSCLLDLLREFSGNRRVLRDSERRRKRHEGSDNQGTSFHR